MKGSYRGQAGQNGALTIQQYKFVKSLRISNAMDKNVYSIQQREKVHTVITTVTQAIQPILRWSLI
jgi:hypothetical protein